MCLHYMECFTIGSNHMNVVFFSSFLRSFLLFFIHLFFHAFIDLFMHLFIHLFIHLSNMSPQHKKKKMSKQETSFQEGTLNNFSLSSLMKMIAWSKLWLTTSFLVTMIVVEKNEWINEKTTSDETKTVVILFICSILIGFFTYALIFSLHFF